MDICYALRDLVPFAQFQKREKHSWSSFTFSKVKSKTPPWVFFTFLKIVQTVQNRATHHIYEYSNFMSLSLQYQVEISVAMSGKVIARVMNFTNDLTDGDRVLGGWKKLRCANKFMDTKNWSCVVNYKCLVIIDGSDYRDDGQWNVLFDLSVWSYVVKISITELSFCNHMLGMVGTPSPYFTRKRPPKISRKRGCEIFYKN